MHNTLQQQWPRCFAHVDMMSFFASIEQLDFPELRGKPVAVINGDAGSTIITASYEARAFKINTGTKLRDAKQRCPQLIARPSRPHRYAAISCNIMAALDDVTPDKEIFSVDECFLELTPILGLYQSIEDIAQHIQQVVYAAGEGLPVSIGISEGKFTAKFCGEYRKGGITIVPPQGIRDFMAAAPVGAICGIGRKIEAYLNAQGIFRCGDLARFPMSVLSRRFGPIGKRLYLTCLGHDPEPLAQPKDPKSMGHSKILPPATNDFQLVSSTLQHQCEKLSRRLRQHDFAAKALFIGIKFQEGWLAQKFLFPQPVQDNQTLWRLAQQLLHAWRREPAFQVQITAWQLVDHHVQQLDLFQAETGTDPVDQLKDAVNERFGSTSLVPANMLQSKKNVPVISPAWRPSGVRQSVK